MCLRHFFGKKDRTAVVELEDSRARNRCAVVAPFLRRRMGLLDENFGLVFLGEAVERSFPGVDDSNFPGTTLGRSIAGLPSGIANIS